MNTALAATKNTFDLYQQQGILILRREDQSALEQFAFQPDRVEYVLASMRNLARYQES